MFWQSSSMEKREIKFWRSEASKGKLLNAIRLERDRAILFFGQKNVEQEDEGQMMYVLNAHEIINASNAELIRTVKRMPRLSREDIADLPSVVRKRLRALEKPLQTQADEMRAYAIEVMRKMKI